MPYEKFYEEFIKKLFKNFIKENTTENTSIADDFTTKDWFIEKFKAGEKSIFAMNDFHKLDEEFLMNIFTNSKNNPEKTYEIPSEIEAKFNYFWEDERKKLEKIFINSKIKNILKAKKPTLFLNPGFGFEENGAVVGQDTSKILNAIICGKIVEELINSNKDYEIYLAFNLKYAGIDIKKAKNVHILFDKRPPILGDSGLGKVFEASSSCMRTVAERLLKINKNIKFLSLCIHHDFSDNANDCGFKSYYQADSNTSKKFQKNSKLACEILYQNCGDIYSIPENEGTEINNHIIEENWAMANLGEIGKKEKYKDINAAAVVSYLGYMSNESQLNKLKQEDLQNEFVKTAIKSIDEIFEIL